MTAYLQVAGLDHRFGGLHALRDCSFAIEQGRITCLVGPNGAGKTTIFNVITGFLKPNEGSVVFRGRKLDGVRPQAIVRAGIARTFQNLRLFTDLSALDNVLVGIAGQFGEEPVTAIFRPLHTARVQQRHRQAAMATLEHVGLADRARDVVRNLSYGEQKLLTIARVLATGAELLLLDEPASGLSAGALDAVMTLLRRLQTEGKTLAGGGAQHARRAADRRRGAVPAPGSSDGAGDAGADHRRSGARGNLLRRSAVMLLQLSGLAAGYGAKTVISDVSFALEPGQILAFLGHNGAGKTTTLKTLMGLLPPRAGEVVFDGQRIDRLDVARRVSLGLRLLPEGRGIFPDLGVAENIDVVAARNVGAAAMFGVADVYRLFPVLEERRTTRAGSLSGGQQQMLALALAILGTPRCLLLDEPSIGLAPNLVERLFQQVREVCKSHAMTAILVEQNVAAAMQIADRVIIMNNGQIVFDGLPQEARESNFWHYF